MQFGYGDFLWSKCFWMPRLTATSRFHTVSYLHFAVPTTSYHMTLPCLDSWHLHRFVLSSRDLHGIRHATYRVLRCPKFQEFSLVNTIRDASRMIRGIAWSGGLLAAGGEDKTLRVYDSQQDWGAQLG